MTRVPIFFLACRKFRAAMDSMMILMREKRAPVLALLGEITPGLSTIRGTCSSSPLLLSLPLPPSVNFLFVMLAQPCACKNTGPKSPLPPCKSTTLAWTLSALSTGAFSLFHTHKHTYTHTHTLLSWSLTTSLFIGSTRACTASWLSLRLDLMASLLIGGIALVAVVARSMMSPPLVGLAMAYAVGSPSCVSVTLPCPCPWPLSFSFSFTFV